MRVLRHLPVIAALSFTAAPFSLAQLSTSATIAGTVTDASGAAVPDAEITITSTETRTVTHAHTSAQGAYTVPGLAVGTYVVTITKSGFDGFVANGVQLHPALTATIDATMKIGGVTESVSVSAAQTQIEVSTPENSNSVESAQINTLPINGRNYQSLASVMPGVQNTSAGTALTSGGRSTNNALSVNGLQQNKVFYALDGIWNENTGNMNQTSVVPNPDSLEEVRVLQNNYSARYSLMGSSVVLLQTKSGTSNFHGTAWEFFRNDALNSKNYFATKVLPYKQNIFGYNLGGPVFIPHIYNRNRDKTFFFWSEQWVVLHQTPTGTLTGITPTANQRVGIFTSPIRNPVTGQNFATNAAGQYVIPAAQINASAQAFLNALYPLPNYSSGSLNYINTVPQITDQRDDEIKIDHNFSPRFHLLAEYLDEYQKYAQNSLSGSTSGEIYSTNAETDFTHNKLAQVALSQVWTPNLVNNTNVGLNIFDLDLTLTGTDYTNQVPNLALTLPYAGYLSSRLPLVSFSGGIGSEGIAAARPLTHAADLDDLVGDDLSWNHGRHFLQTGFSVIFNTKRQNPPSATNGQYTFTGFATRPTTGANTLDDSLADFLLGQAATFTQTSDQIRVPVHAMQISPYVEDRLKLGKNLTVTAGVRVYEMPLPYGPPNSETNFVPSAYSLSNAPLVSTTGTITNTAGFAAHPLNGLLSNGSNSGLPRNFSSAHNWYVGPIVGLAYDVFGDGKTSFRGGYGITYTRVFTNQDCSFACATNPPAINSVNLVNPSFTNPAGTGTARAATIQAVSAADQNIRATQVHTWSAGLQHEFPHNFIASATYAGTGARHLLGTWNYNQPVPTNGFDFDPRINVGNYYNTGASSAAFSPYYYQPTTGATAALPAAQFSPYPGYAAITTYTSAQDQNWNALELSLKHPVAESLFATIAYTYSHDLSDFTSGTFSAIDPYHPSRYYGTAEGLDYRHSLSVTAIYNLPIFAQSRGFAHNVLGGWKYSDVTTLRSGTALSPGLSIANQGNAVRANRVPGASLAGAHNAKQWFNTAAFTVPSAGFYGNAGTGIIRGPGLVAFDMALYKEFHWTESRFFEFRAESFNTFNHTNLTTINTSFGNASFGQATAAADPRVLEFAARLHF